MPEIFCLFSNNYETTCALNWPKIAGLSCRNLGSTGLPGTTFSYARKGHMARRRLEDKTASQENQVQHLWRLSASLAVCRDLKILLGLSVNVEIDFKDPADMDQLIRPVSVAAMNVV